MFDITKESHPGNGSWRSFLEECLFIKCEFIVTMSEKEVYASMCTWKERLEICLHCEGILVSFKNNPSPGNMSQWDATREERLIIDIGFVQFETNSFVEGIGWEKTRYQLDGEIAITGRVENSSNFSDIQLSCLTMAFIKKSRENMHGLDFGIESQLWNPIWWSCRSAWSWWDRMQIICLDWGTILSLIEEGSLELGEGDDARNPRFIYFGELYGEVRWHRRNSY